MFYIRADANKTIATGHVMRCMAIAKQIERLGESCTFITADETARELITENGFAVLCLHTKWDNLEEEVPILISKLKEKKSKVLLVDSYFVTEHYLKQLSDTTKVVYIDDVNQFAYPVHTIIQYGIHVKELSYNERSNQTSLDIAYLIGSKYIPLREEFRQRIAPNRENVANILITTGGTDPYNMAARLIKRLETSRYHLHVVSGKLNIHEDELRALVSTQKNISFYKNVKNMSEIMLACDLAISAAGTTLFELCALGIPTISFSFADNQIAGAKKFDQSGVIDYAGDLRDGIEECLEKTLDAIIRIAQSRKLREEKSKKMQQLVDGYGAMRIASYCLELQREELC
ncbi:MAG: UDP-2,4-diacetamido-2,4,6-trideoxy-beta-L-altropyranose hydrolase [Velocimicrobium sp.]